LLADGSIRYEVAVRDGEDGEGNRRGFPSKKEAKLYERLARDCGFETKMVVLDPAAAVVADPERRKQAKELALLGGGAALAYGALRLGGVSSVSKLVAPSVAGSSAPVTSPTPSTPSDPAAGNNLVAPSVLVDPAGAPPGSIWYRADIGLLRYESGLFGTLSVAVMDPVYGTLWAQPTEENIFEAPILVLGLAKYDILSMTEGGLGIVPNNDFAVTTFNNVLDDTYGNMKAYGTMTASSYYGELGTATLATYPFLFGVFAPGQVLYFDGSDWVNEALSSVAVTSLSAGNGISLSGSTGAVTVSAKLDGTTLSLGSSGLSINLGNANSWSATQTFTNLYPGIEMLGPVSGPASTSSEIAFLGWSGSASIGVNLFADSTGSFKVGQQGSPYNTLLTVDQSGNLNATGTVTGSSFYGELDTATLDSVAFSFTSLTSGQVLYYNGSDWINKTLSGGGVSSLNGLTGAVTLTTPNSTLSIGTSGSDVTLDINLGNANSWSATQTFGNYISIGGASLDVSSLSSNEFLYYNGSNWVNSAELDVFELDGVAFSFGSLTSGQVLYYNGSNWINKTMGAGGVTSLNGLTGALTITTPNSTLSVGTSGSDVTIDINLSNANTWAAAQTFTKNDLLLLGTGVGATTLNSGLTGGSSNTLTLPTTPSDTLAALGTAQEWTAAQTFDSSDLLVFNPAKTFKYTIVASAIGGNYNLTLPPITGNDTLAALATAESWTATQTFGTNISFMGAQLSGSTVANGLLYYNGSNWIAQALANGNGITVSGTTITAVINGTTLSLGASGLSLNLSNANLWSAVQTFGNNISFGGATLNVTSLTTGNILQYNGTNWVNVTAASIAVVSSVSNSDGSLSISPTTGAVVASLNVGNANTWTATQTFGNYISIGGGAFSISGLATGDIIYYNGSDWVNLAAGVANNGKLLEVVAGVPSWQSVSAGGVTSVSNSDGTLTISPTTGAVVASINEAHSNTWTVNQNFNSTVTFEGLASTPSAPASGYALLYAITEATHHRLAYESDEGIQLIITEDNALIGYWNSAGTLAAGNVVYANGQHSGVPIIFQAQANSTSTVPGIGVVIANIGHDVDGWLMQSGLLAGAIGVGSFSAGDRLWQDPATPGGVVNARPVWPNLAQPVGIVLQTSGSGSVLVNVSPFLGGLESGTINATFTIGPSTSQAVTLTSVGQTAQHTMTFPDTSTTLAGLSVAQTFTAVQTFSSFIAYSGANYTAAGLTQGTATAITTTVVYVTGGGATNGLILPTATDGTSVVVQNTLSNAVLIYPNSGANIDGGATNVATSLPASLGVTLTYQASSSTWWSTVDDVASGNGVTATHTAGGIVTVAANLNGTTLSVGASGLSLNLGNANSWSATQTFGNYISIGGASLDVSSLSSNEFLYYNGSNWVNSAELDVFELDGVAFSFGSLTSGQVLYYNGSNWVNATVASLAVAWSSLANPTAALALTMGATYTTAFTLQQTSGTGFTWTSSTLTTGVLAAFASTGTALSGTVSLVTIASTGANSNTAVTAQGLNISVANTNATSGTNVALYLAASGATTANTALELHAGQILSDAAQVWALKSNTASALQITDGTNGYITVNTQTATSGINGVLIGVTNPTLVAAAGIGFWTFSVGATTVTLTGSTGVTNLYGIEAMFARPTITDTSSVTVGIASTVYIAGAPATGGSVTITNPYALYVSAGATYFGGNLAFNGTSLNIGTASAYPATIYANSLTLEGTPSIVWSGTSGNIGSSSNYPAIVYTNSVTFEGATAALSGTYEIAGTPTVYSSLAWNGTSLNFGTSSAYPATTYLHTITLEGTGPSIAWSGTSGNIGSSSAYPATIYCGGLTFEANGLAGTYTIGGTPTVSATVAVSGTSYTLGSSSAYFATIYAGALTLETSGGKLTMSPSGILYLGTSAYSTYSFNGYSNTGTYGWYWEENAGSTGTTIYAAFAYAALTLGSTSYYVSVGHTSATSDSRLKPDFMDYAGDPLAELKAVRFGQYKTIKDAIGGGGRVYDHWKAGVAAETLPDSVRTLTQPPPGRPEYGSYYSVVQPHYDHWIVGVLKAQQAEIEELKARIEELLEDKTKNARPAKRKSRRSAS